MAFDLIFSLENAIVQIGIEMHEHFFITKKKKKKKKKKKNGVL
jgi:hypothetical protein